MGILNSYHDSFVFMCLTWQCDVILFSVYNFFFIIVFASFSIKFKNFIWFQITEKSLFFVNAIKEDERKAKQVDVSCLQVFFLLWQLKLLTCRISRLSNHVWHIKLFKCNKRTWQKHCFHFPAFFAAAAAVVVVILLRKLRIRSGNEKRQRSMKTVIKTHSNFWNEKS